MIYLSKRAKNYIDKKETENTTIYVYDDKWIKKRWKKKEKQIKQLEENVSDLLKKVREDLKSDDDETKQIALATSLIYDTKERIGNDYSADERKHYGVTTWLVKHISFSNGKAKIKYVGKSGVDQEKVIKDSNIISALKDIVKDKKKNDKIFTITPKMVNKYLKKFKITAKDIRGAEANNLLKKELKKQRKGKLPKEEKEKEKKLKEELNNALENVAESLGHQSSTLKNQYIIPSTIETYLSSGKIASLKEELPPWENDEEEYDDEYWQREEEKIRELMTEEEERAYEEYWDNLAEQIDAEEAPPKRHKSEMTFNEIEIMEEMDPEERKEWMSKRFLPEKEAFHLSKRAGQVYIKNSKDKEYSVDMLIEITQNNKIENIPIEYLKWNLEEKVWDNNATPNMVLANPNKYKKDMKRIKDADLKYPILIYNGEIIDGYHRLAKAVKENKKTIKARIITDKQLDASRIDKERVKELSKNAEKHPDPIWKQHPSLMSFLPIQKEKPPGFKEEWDFEKDNKYKWTDGGKYLSDSMFVITEKKANYLKELAQAIGWIILDNVNQIFFDSETNKMQTMMSINKYVFDKKSNRKMRLGRFLQRLKREFPYDEEFINSLINKYQITPKAQEWRLIISAEPSDLRTISTGRGWISCMEQDQEGHCISPLESSIESRDMVAYAVDKNGNWLARSVLRFDGKGGWWADSVYGQPSSIDFNLFKEKVDEWLKSNNLLGEKGRVPPFWEGYSDRKTHTEQSKMKGTSETPEGEEFPEQYKGTGRTLTNIFKPGDLYLVYFKLNNLPTDFTYRERKEEVDTTAFNLEHNMYKHIEYIGISTNDQQLIPATFRINTQYGLNYLKKLPYVNKVVPKSKQASFKLSKRAGPQILIEPYDSAVAKAYQDLPDDIRNSINKIIVHPEGGAGQLGHVEMGPNKDPQEVHIFKNRILDQVNKMFGTTQPTNIQLEDAIHKSLIETLMHEGVHIGPETQMQAPTYRFKDEPSTEQETRRRMTMKFPELAQAKLDEITNKYMLKQATPDLEFAAYCKLDKKYDIVKKGLSLIKQANKISIDEQIKDAIKFNVSKNTIFPNNPDGIINIACFQLENDLTPTGKLDDETLNKMGNLNNFPRNFGIVVPKKLYRGGMIDDIEQLKALKNMGIERVISLHNNPEITRMCNEVGLEHIPAPIEMGLPEEYGRKILGNNVSKLLLEKPTYLHCWFGADRTGGVIARFRTENGWTNKDAYLEAKAYGFKDFFYPLIEWFSEGGEPPIDINLIKMKIKSCPYENPEIKEQDAFTPTPTDQPISSQFEPYYERWSDTKSNVNPIMSLTPPGSIR